MSRLIASRGRSQVQIETTPVMRGTVHPARAIGLSPKAREVLLAELEVPVTSLEDVYGGKLVAAMDRQHPRDLFDVMQLLAHEGITSGIRRAFVVYLAGHNRPMDEVLATRVDRAKKDLRLAYESSFAGMTREPVALSELESARKRLFDELPRRLTMRQRAFLVGLARVEPDWSLVGCAHANELPAIRWRLQNLEQFRDARPREWARQVAALEKALG